MGGRPGYSRRMPHQAPAAAEATPAKPPLRVVFSLDVEEGLFCGTWGATGCGVRSVGLPPKLASLAPEPGFPWRGQFSPSGGAAGSDW